MIACPNCGGNVKFDITTQQLSCEYCHEYFDPAAFDHKTSDGIEEQDFEATVFTCPQCGGEIYSTDNQSAGFCSFCGASTILFSRLTRTRKPNFIIPFKKTKEDCKTAYSKMMKNAFFAPDALKNPKNIDSFRGIYMPYWAYYYTQKGPIHLKGTKSHRRGDYIYTDHYDLSGSLDAYYKGLYYDASSSFADEISEKVAPFDVKGMKKFSPGYLSGFYADTSDVPYEVYQAEAESAAYTCTLSEISKVPAFSGISIDKKNLSTPASLNTRLEGVDSALFPVWFMSYRNKDRVAYATVNGQTGKVVVDIPIDMKKYLLGSALLAVPLFIILSLFLSLVPSKLVFLTSIIAIVSAIIYVIELSRIAKQESLENDRGLLAQKNVNDAMKASSDAAVKSNQKQASTTKKSGALAVFKIMGFIYGTFVAITLLSAIMRGVSFSGIGFWLVALIVMVLTFVFGGIKMSKIPGKESILGFIATAVSVLLGAGICIFDPVYDVFFYVAAILCLIAIILNVRDIVNYYNILSTRKLPQFEKQGGDDRA